MRKFEVSLLRAIHYAQVTTDFALNNAKSRKFDAHFWWRSSHQSQSLLPSGQSTILESDTCAGGPDLTTSSGGFRGSERRRVIFALFFASIRVIIAFLMRLLRHKPKIVPNLGRSPSSDFSGNRAPQRSWLEIHGCASGGEWIYDPFLGSGTTLMAAEGAGRLCCGLELDPKYVGCDHRAVAGGDRQRGQIGRRWHRV